MTKFHQKLENILKKESKFLDQNGNLLKAKLIDYAFNIDEDLIKILINDPEVKKEFFKKIQDVEIFDINHFIDYIKDKNFLNHSYTAFSHKIGLKIGDKFLKSRNEISLSFPYKDCILEGGQSREESKRNEIFFNKILDKDEAKRLLDPKFLNNFEYWDEEQAKKWEEFEGTIEEKTKNIKGKKFKDFTRDKKGVIQDNLLIKGNNLIAMHTIKKQFAGKVKLIYIDPPYNTGNDGFKYNDSFNHSSWLTFMKNRLEIARELLRDDGVIFVQCDDNEQAYLKVLMDEIFGRDNFVNSINWKRRGGSMNQPRCLGHVVDYILFYGKTKDYSFKEIKSLKDDNTQKYIKERFNNTDKNGRKFMKSPVISPKDRPNLKYEFMGILPPKNGWLVSKEKMQKWHEEDLLIIPKDKNQRIYRKIFLDEYEGQPINCLWNDIFVINPMAKESLGLIGQKPEELLKRIIDMTTNPNDLILDFFAGSGTTPAVAHKMNRRWIAIEQMNYIQDLPEARLKKVVAGEKGGISKSVKWQGGGGFVYFELATYNQKLIDKILAMKNDKMLDLWQKIKKEGFLIWNVDIKKFDQNLDEFEKCTLEEKRKILMDILNMNMIYVLLGNCESDEYGFTKDEIELNKSFFQDQYIYTS